MATAPKKAPGRLAAQLPRKMPLALLIGVIVIVAIWFLFVHREAKALTKARTNLATAQAAQHKTAGQLAQTKANPGYLQSLYQMAKKADALLPAQPDPGFLSTLASDATAAGIPAKNQQFSNRLPSGGPSGLNYVPYTVQVTGSYANLVSFMQALGASPELVTFTSVHLNQAQSGSSLYTLSCGVDLWYDSQGALIGG